MRMPKGKRREPEQGLHLVVAQFLDMALPPEAVWWHTPNGGKRHISVAVLLKKMGVLPGVPDVIILFRAGVYGIELKDEDGETSAAQEKTQKRLRAAGMRLVTCRSLESVQKALQGWGFELRARTFEWSAPAVQSASH